MLQVAIYCKKKKRKLKAKGKNLTHPSTSSVKSKLAIDNTALWRSNVTVLPDWSSFPEVKGRPVSHDLKFLNNNADVGGNKNTF